MEDLGSLEVPDSTEDPVENADAEWKGRVALEIVGLAAALTAKDQLSPGWILILS